MMPRVALEGAGLVVASSFDLLGGERRRMVVRHQQRVAGGELDPVEERRLVQAVAESYTRYWAEAFRLPDVTADQLEADITIDGFEHIDAALEAGRGRDHCPLPHLGWMGVGRRLDRQPGLQDHRGRRAPAAEVALRLVRGAAGERGDVGRPPRPRRRAFGARGVGAQRDRLSRLRPRPHGGDGMEVEFFGGERTTLPAGPAMLAMRARSTLLPTAIYFTGRTGHLGIIRPPLPLEREGRFRRRRGARDPGAGRRAGRRFIRAGT